MPRSSSKGIAPQTAKCLLEIPGTGGPSSAGWSDCRFLYLLKRCSAFSPAGGKEYAEVPPSLINCLLSLPFGSHTLLSAPSPPFPKCMCCSLYRCHVAHGTTSWGNKALTSVVQLILTLGAHCTLRISSWISDAITANSSRITVDSITLSCIWISSCIGWCSFFQEAAVSSHCFTQYSYIGISNCFKTAKTCLLLFHLPLTYGCSHSFKCARAHSWQLCRFLFQYSRNYSLPFTIPTTCHSYCSVVRQQSTLKKKKRELEGVNSI